MSVLWRSMLYVPAHVEKYVNSPRVFEADAVILDLQDSVPADAKADARDGVRRAAAAIAAGGPDVLVRINERPEMAEADIDASVGPDVTALVAPSVRDVSDVHRIDRWIGAAEVRNGVVAGSTKLLVLIESARGLLDMAAIAAASDRIAAINLGNEDLATDLGVEPTEEALAVSRQLLVIAAASAGIAPLGLIGSGADFSDPEAYRALAERSKAIGSRGASCIHPSQIAVLNAVFSPLESQLEWARRVVDGAAVAAQAGRGAFSVDGRMIDPPIIARAQNLLREAEAIKAKDARRAAMAT